jgi:hypothetical protein
MEQPVRERMPLQTIDDLLATARARVDRLDPVAARTEADLIGGFTGWVDAGMPVERLPSR